MNKAPVNGTTISKPGFLSNIPEISKINWLVNIIPVI
jgi:hypothetical protein